MKRIAIRAAAALAALTLAACGGDAGNRNGAPADSTQPAGTQPAPTPQTNAGPQLDTSAQAQFKELPVENRDTVRHLGPGQTYASCMARVRGAPEDERVLLEQTCKRLPDAPK